MKKTRFSYWSYLVFFFLAFCIACSPTEKSKSSELPSELRLSIDNGINRGISYTDSLGNNFNLRYIPIKIRNEHISPIRLQIAFSNQYYYLPPNDFETFSLIPLPEAWALERVEITDSMLNEIPNYLNNPFLNVTIKTEEEFLMAIGTLYPRPPKTTGVLPKTLFAHHKHGTFPDCKWIMDETLSSIEQMDLGLKLVMGERCMIIPCGQLSNPK